MMGVEAERSTFDRLASHHFSRPLFPYESSDPRNIFIRGSARIRHTRPPPSLLNTQHNTSGCVQFIHLPRPSVLVHIRRVRFNSSIRQMVVRVTRTSLPIPQSPLIDQSLGPGAWGRGRGASRAGCEVREHWRDTAPMLHRDVRVIKCAVYYRLVMDRFCGIQRLALGGQPGHKTTRNQGGCIGDVCVKRAASSIYSAFYTSEKSQVFTLSDSPTHTYVVLIPRVPVRRSIS